MTTYKVTLFGRQLGAIGVFHIIHTTVEAEDADAARLKLYERFEHISVLELTEV